MEIRTLQPAHLDRAVALSTQAGWNQLRVDWERLLNLWPEFCLGGWEGDQLVATVTLAVYGREWGWIGMVLVDREFRGEGRGTTMLDAIIERSEEAGIDRVGLDATDMGRPVYVKRGFEDHSLIDRWILDRSVHPGVAQTEDAGEVHAVDSTSSWKEILAWDRETVGVDRSHLLTKLRDEPGAEVYQYLRRDACAGCCFFRKGRVAGFIGPILAEDDEALRGLLSGVLQREAVYRSGSVLLTDIHRDPESTAALEDLGFEVQRELTRMTRPAVDDGALVGSAVIGGAGFELG